MMRRFDLKNDFFLLGQLLCCI